MVNAPSSKLQSVKTKSQTNTLLASSKLFPELFVKVFSPSQRYIYVYPSHSYQHCVALLLLRRCTRPLPSSRAVRQLACDNSSFVATIYPLVFGFTHRVHSGNRTATGSERLVLLTDGTTALVG